ncbi:non-homologous end-joining DNA ligase [Pseudonocardia sp.]|uniref:non-homologous end-joining DNA ligase n=1 Tax=Pseudonocardia sp. TaxID=60912 RepID=UPI0026226923|nr:non-homologous end-joining DNA ligase [Pseudonocardia sp.]
MLATPGALPAGPDWLYEVKWDGMRLLADVADSRLTLRSRSGRDVTTHFPELADLLTLAPDVLLDGEVVLLENGVPSFSALADRMHRPIEERAARARPVTFMAFDILRLYGVSLLDRPFDERRATLERLDAAPLSTVSLSPIYTDGPALLDATAQRGMEGVVAKQRGSVYRPGRRSPGWVKVTHRRTQPCLVGGWREERTSASRIGALLLGVLDRTGLAFAGRVGSGLAGDSVQRVLGERLTTLAAPSPPFTERLPRLDAEGAHWCEPGVVVEVAHLGWTKDGRLRQPVFRGIRDDLDAPDAVREP